jgi:hypothetical protein
MKPKYVRTALQMRVFCVHSFVAFTADINSTANVTSLVRETYIKKSVYVSYNMI